MNIFLKSTKFFSISFSVLHASLQPGYYSIERSCSLPTTASKKIYVLLQPVLMLCLICVKAWSYQSCFGQFGFCFICAFLYSFILLVVAAVLLVGSLIRFSLTNWVFLQIDCKSPKFTISTVPFMDLEWIVHTLNQSILCEGYFLLNDFHAWAA